MRTSFTDSIYQNVKLYIEGVQVPFSNISITTGIGGFPSANIVVPAQAGLMDIARFYSPKVHIFFTDRFGEYDESNPDDIKKKDKLLFSGVIAQVSFNKTKQGGGSVAISFSCVHRYTLIQEMLIDYSGWMNADPLDLNVKESAIKSDNANSRASIIEALAGITSISSPEAEPSAREISSENPDGKTSVLPARYAKYLPRIIGMPSILYNFWNQMRRSAYNRYNTQNGKAYSESFIRIYQPLIETGLKFFDRIGGHFPVESFAQGDDCRIEPCPNTPNLREKILVPPITQTFFSAAVAADVTINSISTYLQNSGEITSIYGIFTEFFSSIEYDVLTLASPAKVALRRPFSEVSGLSQGFKEFIGNIDEGPLDIQSLDTVVKPRLPFYFAPTCNVLFPGMYTSVSVMYDEFNIPTRVNLKNSEAFTPESWKTNFRAPASIREAIATKVAGRYGTTGQGFQNDMPFSLRSTTGSTFGAIGIYEQSRGIKLDSIQLPRWLSLLSQSSFGKEDGTGTVSLDKDSDAVRYNALQKLEKGWATRYPGDQVKTLNPYTTADTLLHAHQRMLFTTADYYYTQVYARSKAGRVECPFNPYIVPGYPMDILEQNPLYPSFHANCISVTHNISAESVTTSVDFTAAITYSELANYYVPFVSPMLQVTLGLAENPTLLNEDEDTKAIADDFYRYTLGTSAALPAKLIDFSNLTIRPKQWNDDSSDWEDGSTESVRGPNGGEQNPMLSFEGNLSLTKRDIESRYDIEQDFGVKFIDMDPGNYGSIVMKIKPDNLEDSEKFDIGQSQFVEYKTYFGGDIDNTILPPKPPDNINGF